ISQSRITLTVSLFIRRGIFNGRMLRETFEEVGNDKILLPSSSVSFRNLTKLVAVGCKELIHLVTSSTAKTLVRLVTVQVYGCRAMTEVVINDKEGVDIEEIVFSKLKALILCDLDSLTSFCSANYTFKFPSLEYLEVIGCPKMKTFTSGESNTPPR
ncbi:hypothetical protein CISIN_1g0393751mg, partial [Citrus sinensis]